MNSSTTILNSSRQGTRQQQTQAIHIVVERHLGLVVQIAKRYAKSHQGFWQLLFMR